MLKSRGKIGSSVIRGVPDSHFSLNTINPIQPPPMQAPLFAPQVGRGAINQPVFKPPIEPVKTTQKKLANGLTQIKEVKPKKDLKHDNDCYDESGNLDWEKLEDGRKRKPCEKLLKKLKKGKTKIETVR